MKRIDSLSFVASAVARDTDLFNWIFIPKDLSGAESVVASFLVGSSNVEVLEMGASRLLVAL